MVRSGISTPSVLDEAVDLVSRRVPGPAGLLLLTSLPLRFLEAWLANRLLQLGDGASDYVSYLTSLSFLVTLALLPAWWGRAVYARACALALTAGAEGYARMPLREQLRLSPAGFLAYLYAAAACELLFFAVGWTIVAVPVLALLSGLAAATSYLDERPGFYASLLRVVRHAPPLGVLIGLTLVFCLAVPVAFFNLFVLFQLLVWLASGTTGLDGSWWSVALSFESSQFLLLALAGAVLILEPFWLAALVAAVRRARARQSGEDLASWFSALRSRAALLFAVLALLPALLSAQEALSIGAYRERLAGIDDRLRSGDWVGARTEARGLLDDRIVYGGEVLEPDLSILRPLADAPDAATARAAAPRLSHLVAALGETPPVAAPAADPKTLDEVRKRQAVAELPLGGQLPEKRTSLLETIGEIIEPFFTWLRDLWERFWDWLTDLFPDEEEGGAAGLNLPTLVTAVVVLLAALAVWLAWRVFRNRRRRGDALVAAAAGPLPLAADDDPLSRASSEWERYAAELAAAGRFREAVRAWYHAVLVTLFRRGTLHYRKGRTNWEYVAALAPGYDWRSRFIELTRHFEREWYGRDQSTPESLREAEDMARGLLGSLREAA